MNKSNWGRDDKYSRSCMRTRAVGFNFIRRVLAGGLLVVSGLAAAAPEDAYLYFQAGPGNDTTWVMRQCSAVNPCDSASRILEDASTPLGGDAFDGAYGLTVGSTPFPTVTQFDLDTTAKTFRVGPQTVEGLDTQIQFKFFDDRRLVRVLYIFTNPGASDVTRNISVVSSLGSDGSTAVRGSASGDTALTIADRWVVTSDSAVNSPNDSVVTSVFFGAGPVVSTPTFLESAGDNLSVTYSLTIPAGQTRALMLFSGLDNLVGGGPDTNEAAIASAALFDDSDAFEMEGLLTDFAGVQPTEVANWNLESIDITPDAFDVKDKVGVTVDSIVNAVAITVTGIDAPAPVTVTGAPNSEFLTSSNSTWRTTGFVNNNEPLRVRHRSAPTPNTMATTTLCIGPESAPVCDTFNTITADGADATPNAFSFSSKTGLALGVPVNSLSVVITGYAVDVPATIDVGEYQISNNGPWVTSGMVPPNSGIRIRHTTSSLSEGEVVSTLTVGGVSGTFTSRTGDAVPNAFSFPAKTVQPISTLVESASVTLQGIAVSTQARVSNGEVSVDSGPWSAGPVTVQNGSMVRVRHTTAAIGSTNTTTTLCVGPVSQQVCGAFVTTTADITPNAFSWPNKNGVATNTVINSLYAQIKGFEGPLTLTIDVGQFQVGSNNAPWVTSAQITAPASIRVRHTSSAACNGSTTSTLTVGGVSGTFTTVTAACPP